MIYIYHVPKINLIHLSQCFSCRNTQSPSDCHKLPLIHCTSQTIDWLYVFMRDVTWRLSVQTQNENSPKEAATWRHVALNYLSNANVFEVGSEGAGGAAGLSRWCAGCAERRSAGGRGRGRAENQIPMKPSDRQTSGSHTAAWSTLLQIDVFVQHHKWLVNTIWSNK